MDDKYIIGLNKRVLEVRFKCWLFINYGLYVFLNILGNMKKLNERMYLFNLRINVL